MGNKQSNTIIQTGMNNIYNKNRIYSWIELKGEPLEKAVLFLIGKGFKIIIKDKNKIQKKYYYIHKPIKYNRIILINNNGIVDNYPVIG
jgi:hypothetical protein